MTVTVYLDVYFITNFIMNLLLLLLMANRRFPGRRKIRRMVFAAIVGAGFACLCLLFAWQVAGIVWMIEWIMGAGVMIFIAFGKSKWKQYGENLIIFLMLSVLLEGFLSILKNGLKQIGLWKTLPLYGAGIIGFVVLSKGLEICRKKILRVDRFCQVRLHYRGKEKMLIALRDSGNLLYEPYGHQPVHVISSSACCGWCESLSTVIYIPFTSVGKGHGILPGIQMDYMEVWDEKQGVTTYSKPWIAISKEPVSPDNQYQMLLHGE